MRLKCKKPSRISDRQVRSLTAHIQRDRNEYDLTIVQEYVALGLGFWDGRAWVEVTTEGGFVISVPLDQFEIVSGESSAFWELRVDADGSVKLWPPSFYRPAYHADLADREPGVVADFEQVREKLEAEARGQLTRLRG
jgi:hypothetical protein